MKPEYLDEPEVEFAGGGRHIDPRYGILNYGPVDRASGRGLKEIRVGVVGTEESVDKLTEWLSRCSRGLDGQESRQPRLHPRFPGMGDSSPFAANLVMDPRLRRVVPRRFLEPIISRAPSLGATSDAVTMFLEQVRDVCEEGPPPHVVVVAPPSDLLDALEAARVSVMSDEPELDEGGDDSSSLAVTPPAFHDLLKARGLMLNIVPMQMVRATTYDPAAVRKRKKPASLPGVRRVQDEATRAWNFFTALYHKAGGTLWRLSRDSVDLTTCYVGTSFYFSRDSSRVMASVAQVFNERGDGMIVKGGPAVIHKDDRQPHLARADARALLANALATFRQEHKTTPARIVVHKTSSFDASELEGMEEAAAESKIEIVDLVWLRRSQLKLFRTGTYPVLRGTWLPLSHREGLVYLRGSVPFFESYPGLYVPRPIEYRCERFDSENARPIAEELLELSKLNWNNTQFDGGEPITVRAARRVGDIMKCIPEGGPDRLRFKYFM